MNKLFKSRKDRILCGVCAGVGEYFGFTPDMVRMLTIIFAIFFPITLIIYILMCIFVEDEP